MTEHKKLLIVGFGGHARAVADIAIACGYVELAFVDEHARQGESFFGYPVLERTDDYIGENWAIFPAAGNNQKRQAQCATALARGFSVATLISPKASVGIGVAVSPGCFIGHHAHIGPMTQLGQACIINTGAIIEHECHIGNFCHVSVNATIAGRSSLGDHSMLGAGATVIDKIFICNDVTVGAGAVVTKPIKKPGTYIGTPAKQLIS